MQKRHAVTNLCRTRVIADRHGWNTLSGKGNLSFVTIPLPRLGLKYGVATGRREKPDMDGFYNELRDLLNTCAATLHHRFQIQAKQKAKASDFMMREGGWRDGKTLKPDDKVGELLKHGSLSIGYLGLAECCKALFGKHHGEDSAVWAKAYEIIKVMREFCDMESEKRDLNYSLFATPAEGIAGKFIAPDRKAYGIVEGVNDHDYYTNSFHVPVYHQISGREKIQLEAPFHELNNAGAIGYVEFDGNARQNPKALYRVIEFALNTNMSYFSINFHLDMCPKCKYEGIIGGFCPNCGIKETDVHFKRIRRVTGYLTGDYEERFNPAKQSEVHDRVKHIQTGHVLDENVKG